MGQAKRRGTFEQRIEMARERDAVLKFMFAEKDHTTTVVRDSLRLIPMTPDKLRELKARSLKVLPG